MSKDYETEYGFPVEFNPEEDRIVACENGVKVYRGDLLVREYDRHGFVVTEENEEGGAAVRVYDFILDGHPYPIDRMALTNNGIQECLECRATFGVGNTYVATYDIEGRMLSEVYEYTSQEINTEAVSYIKKLHKAYDDMQSYKAYYDSTRDENVQS